MPPIVLSCPVSPYTAGGSCCWGWSGGKEEEEEEGFCLGDGNRVLEVGIWKSSKSEEVGMSISKSSLYTLSKGVP